MKRLLNKSNVVGFGTGTKIKKGKNTKTRCLKVFVTKKMASAQLTKKDMIPKRYRGRITDVEEIGEVYAHQNPRRTLRPIPGGASIGHIKVTAGTVASVVYRKEKVEYEEYEEVPENLSILRGLNEFLYKKFKCKVMKVNRKIKIVKNPYILSNNHVLANSSFSQNKAEIGESILQPGRYDGGTEVIAKLKDFVPLNDTSYVDCAIAKPLHKGLVRQDILGVGSVKGVNSAHIGQRVQKFGRTTNYTTGRIKAINVTIRVNGYKSKTVVFRNQILLSKMSAPGDSGSLILDMDNKAIGLLFAGSDKVTIANPIKKVLEKLKVELP